MDSTLSEGPDEGHTFRFEVVSRASGSDWWGEPWTMEVRAWSLYEAVRAMLGRMEAGPSTLSPWTMPDD